MLKNSFFQDFEHKNSSNVFQKLEENCLLAFAYFRTENGNGHLRYLLVPILIKIIAINL